MAGSGLGGLARNRTGAGRVLFDSGDESGLWRRLWGSGEASPESGRSGLILSDFGDGAVWRRELWGCLPQNRTKAGWFCLILGMSGEVEGFLGIGQEWAVSV